MPLKKLMPNKYPNRHWAIYGPPGAGKSTLAAQMTAPLAFLDADGRATEIVKVANGEVYALDTYHGDLLAIVRDMEASLSSSGCRTLVIDSLTSLIGPIINRTLLEIDQGEHKNKIGAWKDKATAYKAILDAAINSGLDFALIYHVGEARDSKANLIERATVSQTELIRMRRALNMILRVEVTKQGHSVTIEWARNGRSGITLDDHTGCWRGMPAAIEKAVYDGLSEDEKEVIEHPTSFPSKEAAIAWGFEQGCFRDAIHAANAYEEVKRTHNPKSAAAMWTLWIEEVQKRKAMMEPMSLGTGELSAN